MYKRIFPDSHIEMSETDFAVLIDLGFCLHEPSVIRRLSFNE